MAYEAGKFDLSNAMQGYNLNKMCHSLNVAENRALFLSDEAKYCADYGLNADEASAVIDRNKPKLFSLGGNMYFLAKLDRTKKDNQSKAKVN